MSLEGNLVRETLENNMALGRVPLIIIGAGMSAGVGAPTMRMIHKYLQNEIKKLPSSQPQSPNLQTIRRLLDILVSEKSAGKTEKSSHEDVSPRSIQVRLYNLLQSSDETPIWELWRKFGVALLAGELEENLEEPEKEIDESSKKKKKALWALEPSPAHYWAASLAMAGRARLVSLNYDGLTKRAIDALANPETQSEQSQETPYRHVARILSSPAEIRGFFTGEERATDEQLLEPIPLIKFRGDVFHAVCENGRCPDSVVDHASPLYALFTDRKRRKQNIKKVDENTLARKMLRCPSCGQVRTLKITFPGVYDKEKEIAEALAAFHEIGGASLAGVIFMGFSGRWDEELVGYLVERAAELKIPVVSISHSETPAIRRVATEYGAKYWPITYRSVEGISGVVSPELENILPVKTPQGQLQLENFKSVGEKSNFPAVGFLPKPNPPRVLKLQKNATLPTSEVDRTIEITPGDNDSFGKIADVALSVDELQPLKNCSQLGVKSLLLKEDGETSHTRYSHSFCASHLAVLWHELLLRSQPAKERWDYKEDARLALEIAVLFHDARHLPFGHMMEEIFKELNWGGGAGPAWPGIPQHTKEVIPKLDGTTDFSKRLSERLEVIGYSKNEKIDLGLWWNRVRALQNGTSGMPWLEGIVDSALDADKIEYIFRDTHMTGQSVRLTNWDSWFATFLEGQRLTPEGLIRLERESCFAALTLLEERMHLYRRLYLAPELRSLESFSRYIITTWLEWNVPEKLKIAENTSYGPENDLRWHKAQIAADLLIKEFSKFGSPKAELLVVEKMKDDLIQDKKRLDVSAREWIKSLWKYLAPFKDASVTEEGGASLRPAQEQFWKLSPIGPLYIHKRHEKLLRLIVRRWRVQYPLVAFVDTVVFPSFLATPKNRFASRLGSPPPVTECFLVPGDSPGKWRHHRDATVPLHRCDFKAFEMPAIQILILDPSGSAGGGAAFLHQMLRRDFRQHNIEVFENIESVPKT